MRKVRLPTLKLNKLVSDCGRVEPVLEEAHQAGNLALDLGELTGGTAALAEASRRYTAGFDAGHKAFVNEATSLMRRAMAQVRTKSSEADVASLLALETGKPPTMH